MSELVVWVPSDAPEIESGELRYPSEDDLGTGTFLIFLAANALTATKWIVGAMVNHALQYQVSASISPQGAVEILLGQGPTPPIKRIYTIPAAVDPMPPHTLAISFADWDVLNVELDKQPLALS